MDLSLKESFERCCRLCAEEQEVTIMLFSTEAEAMRLQNKLRKYLLIEVDEDDKLPKNICVECCTKLQSVCQFIDTAHKSQNVLLERNNMIEEYNSQLNSYAATSIKREIIDDNAQVTQMEINVDPMMVLQNTDQIDEKDYSGKGEDIVHWHGVDRENVTIKLIKSGPKSDCSDDGNSKDSKFKPFPCNTCKRGFFTELALKNHSWMHFNEDKDKITDPKSFKCYTCNASFGNKYIFSKHIKEHKITKICRLCGRGFRTQRALAAHMAIHSSGNRVYTCKVCGRSYNTMSNLKAHSVTHSNERPYHCPMCKKCFKRNQDLKFHINQHTGEKPYKCPFCEKCFASSGNCYSHKNRMHPGRTEGKVRRRVTTNRENQPQFVPIAPKPSDPIKSTMVFVKGMYKYQCQICDHTFVKRDNFTYHMFQHTGVKPFQCSFCNEKFVTRRGLLIHHDAEHPTKDRPLALLSKNVLLK